MEHTFRFMKKIFLMVVSYFVAINLFAEEVSQTDNVNIQEVSHGGFGLLKGGEESPSIIFMREGATCRYFLEMITTYEMDNLMLFYLGKTKEQVRQCLTYFQKIMDDKEQVTVKDDVKSVYSISCQSEFGRSLRFSTSGFKGEGYLSKANIRKFISDLEKFVE